jgi:2-amino-4-hydroxy-6-hydroxymethyldihydropteridine diphosphokinase
MSELAHLSLGSNMGDREDHLNRAITELSSLGTVKNISSFYETDPVEFVEQPVFLNCAVALQTDLSPMELIGQILNIEHSLGRQRIQKKGPRSIDIDILLFGDRVIESADLTIPHPAMALRRFVLLPLTEIAPDACHPVLNKTARELLEELPPGQNVWKFCKSH